MTIPDPLRQVTAGDTFAVLPGRSVSYGEMDRRVDHTVAQLQAKGFGLGDRLAIHAPDLDRRAEGVLQIITLILAGWRLGLTVLPLNNRFPAEGVAALLHSVGGAALVGEGGLDIDDLTTGELLPGWATEWHLDRVATGIFTSGTTGQPRAAAHTLRAHVASANGWAERHPLGRGDRWLLDLPLYHVGGLAVMVRCLLAGATLAIPDHGKTVASNAAKLGVTHISAVPTQLRRALEEDVDLSHLRLVLLGGAGVPRDVLEEAARRGWPVATSYGMTEMASTITATDPERPEEALASSGSVLPGREVRLADDGEIMLRGPALFQGYLRQDGLYLPVDEQGWFASGDLGEWVEIAGQRLLRVVGRRDNMFISGGENIQPEVIEAALLAIPAIRQAVVVAVPDATFGHRPVAFVDAGQHAPDDWIRTLEGTLPRYMIPAAFHPWPTSLGEGRLKPARADFRRLATG